VNHVAWEGYDGRKNSLDEKIRQDHGEEEEYENTVTQVRSKSLGIEAPAGGV
jgi:hypothetical protein